MKVVGRVVQLARYPVKSMRGEVLPSATLTLDGLPHDRRYAFVQAESRSDFPWLTARQLPELLLYTPAVVMDPSGETTTVVTTPGGEKLVIDSDELLEEIAMKSGRKLFLLHNGRGSYDAAPISLISGQTVARIAAESGTEPNPWRFRPNFLVDLAAGDGFEELNWVGRVLRIGGAARIAITEADQRCMMITLDPATTSPCPQILRCVVQQHDKCAGVYGAVLTVGEVRGGDAIWIEG